MIAGRRHLRLEDLDAAQALLHAGDVVPAWRREPKRAGWRLRRFREAAELTQVELAARSGLTHEAISNLERGRRAPLASTVRRLAQALAVEPAAFVTGTATERGLTTEEAAARLGVPVSRVQTWLLTGRLTGWKVSGQWRVVADSVAALASERCGCAVAPAGSIPASTVDHPECYTTKKFGRHVVVSDRCRSALSDDC